jgi:hypothetical protein
MVTSVSPSQVITVKIHSAVLAKLTHKQDWNLSPWFLKRKFLAYKTIIWPTVESRNSYLQVSETGSPLYLFIYPN